ncbi:ATPase family AAA domain-containing protein 5 [Latimeria chalumnae]|uniref:ATPase family AAA domain-containing protein 5 n=1 Tax=Latimeria chalumnae TaxID=7897 RepID=UPI0006D93B03|nr:PREDICTED: ATPase family AAA domain-containing protein 5 [Latimeria chalumnae]|eukprot:XP_014342593.1 PREDICTED: ATPase family AAA domain-containing protein 5 [Latimeria chalumnae]
MVGMLAMADAVEDFDFQPCKKQRKESHEPLVKTITNYFSPVSRTKDTVFTPLKSNNIRDYFKLTSPANEKTTPPHKIKDSKLNSPENAEPETSLQTPSKPATNFKKRGKKVNLNQRISAIKKNEAPAVVDLCDRSNDSERVNVECVSSSTNIYCSKAPPLLAQICAEDQKITNKKKKSNGTLSLSAKRKKAAKKVEFESTPEKDLKDGEKKLESKKDVLEQSKEQQKKGEQCENGIKRVEPKQANDSVLVESESTFSDASLEVNVDKMSWLNDSTVTVSFEDFLKSQEESRFDLTVESKTSELNDGEIEDGGSAVEPMGTEVTQQVSPRTLTVYAQVHSVPQTPTSSRPSRKISKKIASIFLKKKDCEPKRLEPVLLDSESPEKVDLLAQKRRSNVVIEEGELELAVLEVGSHVLEKPKCTQEEREQFMKAFRQPVSETGRKCPIKQRDSQEKPSKQKDELHTGESRLEQENKPRLNRATSKALTKKELEGDSVAVKTGKKLKKRGRKASKQGEAKLTTEDVHSVLSQENTKVGPKSRNARNANQNFENSINSPVQENNERVTRRSLRIQQVRTPSSTIPVNLGNGETLLSPEKFTEDGPVQVSTPKTERRSLRKEDAYRAEVITVLSDTESPIRMRFTRVSRRTKTREIEDDAAFTPRSSKKRSASKGISKAKQLVEKAKFLQQSKSKAVAQPSPSLRRSSRQHVLAERKISLEEDSAIFLDSQGNSSRASSKQTAEKKQKNLPSLNDVLGKNTRIMKARTKSKGNVKVAPLFLGKKAPKPAPSGPVSIFDDSSQDSSESSEDDEQCRARREFLKSGLPDSLRRHIAKTVAAREAYSTACASFQVVTHVQQKDHSSVMWSLPWPPSALLRQLRKLNVEIMDVKKLSISLGDLCFTKFKSTATTPKTLVPGLRTNFSEPERNILLEEIRFSNPQFPVRRVFKQLLKKRNEHLAENAKAGSENTVKLPNLKVENEKQSDLGDNLQNTTGKRKRNENAQDNQSKRKAFNVQETTVLDGDVLEEQQRRKEKGGRAMGSKCEAPVKGRLSRSSRKTQPAVESSACTAETQKTGDKLQKSDVILIDDERDSTSEAKNVSTGSINEDLLWTEKYQPQHFEELIGNSGAVKKIHSWLKKWKLIADKEEKQKQEKAAKEKEEDSCDSTDFEHERSGDDGEEEEFLCNTLLLTGPLGVGKTAAVYACAQELGFKVFEVNASCQRNGRQILSQLKEATQSHQVDNAHKPAFFSNYSSSKSPRKQNSPQKVVSSPRKSPLSPRGAGPKRELAPTSLTNFFKVMPKAKTGEEKKSQRKKRDEVVDRFFGQQNCVEVNAQNAPTSVGEESSKKSATSLILFEEVDVIFDEDAGFLSAVKTFMATTKRPVILTTSDPTFSLVFDGCFEEIQFKMPSLVNVASYLQLLCLVENVRTDVKDIFTLLTTNNCDIRQSVLSLQFWIKSGGGYLAEKPVCIKSQTEVKDKTSEKDYSEDKTGSRNTSLQTEGKLQNVPKCDTGCIESLYGLKNITSPLEDALSIFKCKAVTAEGWSKQVQLLTRFQREKVNFIHSNLEFLLPLPVYILSDKSKSHLSAPAEEEEEEEAGPPCDASLPKDVKKLLESDHSVESSPVKMSTRMRRRRKLEILNDSDLFESDSNSTDAFLSSNPTSVLEENHKETKNEGPKERESSTESKHNKPQKKPKTPEEQKCSALELQCLNSLAEFVDNMSFLNSCLYTGVAEKEGSCVKHDISWTTAEMKNGLSDESSIEHGNWWHSQCSEEARAVLEALSFQKCRSNISQVMETSHTMFKELGKDPVESLTLSVPEHKGRVAFSHTTQCNTSAVQKRLKAMKTVFSSRAFTYLGNRQANTVEYLPALRNICRSERQKERGKTKRRFLHYFEGIHLELPKVTLETLAQDFP